MIFVLSPFHVQWRWSAGSEIEIENVLNFFVFYELSSIGIFKRDVGWAREVFFLFSSQLFDTYRTIREDIVLMGRANTFRTSKDSPMLSGKHSKLLWITGMFAENRNSLYFFQLKNKYFRSMFQVSFYQNAFCIKTTFSLSHFFSTSTSAWVLFCWFILFFVYWNLLSLAMWLLRWSWEQDMKTSQLEEDYFRICIEILFRFLSALNFSFQHTV